MLKNLLGIVLVLAGLAMLVLPGQGLLSIILGLALTNFPGKFKLQRRLVGYPSVLNSLNWLRRRFGRPSFLAPEVERDGS
ncbi:MAG: PGPGW domain-containing protein [Desulfohalobiaceae bacterium]